MVIWKSRPLAAVVAATALCFGGAAQADLVTNGGFETGDLSGWAVSSPDPNVGVDGQNPHSGTFGAFFGPFDLVGISQTLSTIAGRTYHVEFWLQNEQDPFGIASPNSFEFNWNGGVAELSLTDQAAFGYTKYEFFLDATAASTDISFTFTHIPAFWDLDDVSANIPEPGSLALVGLAGAAAFFARRRRISTVTE